jgi:hypothetical protein
MLTFDQLLMPPRNLIKSLLLGPTGLALARLDAAGRFRGSTLPRLRIVLAVRRSQRSHMRRIRSMNFPQTAAKRATAF